MKTYEEYQKEQYQKQLQAEAEGAREAAILNSITDVYEDTRTDEEKYIARVEAEQARAQAEAETQAALNDSIAHWDTNFNKVLAEVEAEAYNEAMTKVEADNLSEEEARAAAMEQEQKRQAKEQKKNLAIPIEDVALAVGAYKQKIIASFKKHIIEYGTDSRYISSVIEDIERAIRLERALKFAQGKEVSIND